MSGSATHWYVDRVHEPPVHRCLQCDRPLVWVEAVGWIDVVPGDAYDLCDADPFGNHVATPIGRVKEPGTSPWGRPRY